MAVRKSSGRGILENVYQANDGQFEQTNKVDPKNRRDRGWTTRYYPGPNPYSGRVASGSRCRENANGTRRSDKALQS